VYYTTASARIKEYREENKKSYRRKWLGNKDLARCCRPLRL